MRDIIALHFDLEDVVCDRRKRFRIREGLPRRFTRPSAAELAGLTAEVAATAASNPARSGQLASLLTKVTSALNADDKRVIDADLEPLRRLQRVMPSMGPVATVTPQAIAAAQSAILAGCCLAFDYVAGWQDQVRSHCVVPHGLVHGVQPYLVGTLVNREYGPIVFRFDRMTNVQVDSTPGLPAADWNLDVWLSESIGLWRGDAADIVLRILPHAAERGRTWHFHPHQRIEAMPDGGLRIVFNAGGLRELAEHLFVWAGDLVIESPAELRKAMRRQLTLAREMVRV